MALEKNLFAVAPKLFTADGGSAGKVLVANACDFKVKQRVKVSGTALPQLDLEVKRVIGDSEMYLGPVSGPISDRTDLSAYTTAGEVFPPIPPLPDAIDFSNAAAIGLPTQARIDADPLAFLLSAVIIEFDENGTPTFIRCP